MNRRVTLVSKNYFGKIFEAMKWQREEEVVEFNLAGPEFVIACVACCFGTHLPILLPCLHKHLRILEILLKLVGKDPGQAVEHAQQSNTQADERYACVCNSVLLFW